MKRGLTAPPNGLAKLAIAVAAILPFSPNHISLKLVGAHSTKGCADPTSICPNMVTPYRDPGPAPHDAAYRIQFPTSNSKLAATIACLGPPRLSVYMVRGVATRNANRKAVESQFTAVTETCI